MPLLIPHDEYLLHLLFRCLRGFSNSFDVTWEDQQTTSLGLEKTLIKITEIKHKPKKGTRRVTLSHKLVQGISTKTC